MKKILSQIIGSSIIASLLVVPLLSVRAEDDASNATTPKREQIREVEKNRMEQAREIEKGRLEQIREREQKRLENLRASTTLSREERLDVRKKIVENIIDRASTTEKRLENRENNIERIRERIASTTASTSEKRLDNLDKRLEKQQEQMGKAKERLLEKELKIADVLGKIAEKIQGRIKILTDKGLDMVASNAKLAQATAKIESMTAETANLSTLVGTVITEANQAQLFTDIRASQDKIRTLAREAHGLLVDSVKEITKVLPRNNKATTTTTSTEDKSN
ncbi:MAG: hypothetical protein WCP24_03035 [bacterium]